MWIRHLPADYYKQQSDFDNLVFLWKTNNVYVMDNHLAAAWCWMQECNTDTRYNFLHIDRHNDLGTNTPFDIYRHIKDNQHLSIDEYTNLSWTNEGNGISLKAFRWDNYITQCMYLFPQWFWDVVYSTRTSLGRSEREKLLGATIIEIARKINRLKSMSVDLQREKTKLIDDIKNLIHYNDVETVVKLAPKKDIDILLSQKQQEFKISSNNEVIIKHEELPNIKSFTLPFNTRQIKSLLQKSIDCISEQYLTFISQRVNTLKNNGLSNAEKWLADGLAEVNTINDDSCPFCGQSLSGAKEIIDGYNLYFSKEYNQLINSINLCNSQFQRFDVRNFIRVVTEFHEKLMSQYHFWQIYLKDLNKVTDMPAELTLLEDDFSKVQEKISEKAQNPLSKIENDNLEELEVHLGVVFSFIEELKKYVAYIGPLITKLKSTLKPLDTVRKELRALEIYKLRYESPLKEMCEYFIIVEKQILRLQKLTTQLQNEQKENSAAFLHDYGDIINNYLQNVFCTDFRIENIKDGGYRGRSRDASLTYSLTFKGKPLSLDTDDNLSFKNTLSEGDKNTIAFSLFLAKLDKYSEEELKDKIIVFDDPLTSLDLNRRNATINELVKMYQKTKQTLVLSHNLAFLLELNNRRKIKGKDKKVLLIEKQIDKSIIREFKLRDELSAEFASCIEKIEKFKETGADEDMEPAINSIRLSLEAILKFKYGRYLSTLDGTFGQIISELEKSSTCRFVDGEKQKVIDDLNELNEMSWRAHHASVDELGMYSEISVTKEELFRRYIPMTINLLFGRL